MIQVLPVSQLSPVYPGTQSQVYDFIPSVQVPPFSQGLDIQSSMSIGKKNLVDVKIISFSFHIFSRTLALQLIYPPLNIWVGITIVFEVGEWLCGDSLTD